MNLTVCMPIAEARGGAEVLLDRFVASAKTTSLQLSVIFLEDGPMASEFQRRGVPVRVVKAGRLRHLSRIASATTEITRALRSFNTDIVLSWMTKAHVYAALPARRLGLPSVWFQHGIPEPGDAVTRLATLLPADGILACSNYIAEAQAQLRPHRPTRSVYPCVDGSAFDPTVLPSPRDARRELGLPENGPLIGMVARMQRWKGVHVFVDAMNRVHQAYPNVHGVIVGGRHDLEPDYPALIQQQIKSLNLSDQVTVAGFQPNIPLWMQAMDVVVHASDREPFGMVVIEAMSLGKPVVAGNAGGPREIITAGRNGLLAGYGDAEEVAARIMEYLADPARAGEIGRAARQRASDFSVASFAPRLASALTSITPATILHPAL